MAADLPDLGDVATAALSPMAEKRLGESIMQQIRWRDASYLNDPEIEDYVNRLGMRLVAASDEPDRSFDFFVLKDSTLNAFALPGGYIGLHSGLIQAAQSESELASVVGHEIAHVTQRHIAQLFGKQSQMGMVMLASILVAILAARSNADLAQAAIASGQAGAIQSQLGYTRAFEREADRIGLQTLENAGFDTRGMPSFFERLQRESRLYENNAPGYLRTHPLTEERIADMGNRVDQTPYRQVPDSADFGFVRAKLRASEGIAGDAVKYFEARLAGSKDPANQYGYLRALLRANQVDRAAAGLETLRASAAPSTFIERLAADIELERKNPRGAVALLESALKRFPGSMPLQYALIDALLQAGDTAEAATLARDGALRHPGDVNLWALSSRAEAERGRMTAHHRAQAEVYVRRGSLPAAIEQLESARRANDGDFHELSAVDARMRELKTELRIRREESER
nr:M48 family metallopeptidase [Zoogloeaceae bacterium]